MQIQAGEIVCLSGPSGSGKTRLLRAIADLEPYHGSVYLDSINSQQIPAPQWRSQVGMLAAESAWWADRVDEHFLSRPAQIWLDALLLPAASIHWQISRLSSGEKQRLAIARLLALGPRALLLDEPSANLDPSNVFNVEEIVCNYSNQHRAPILWISHDEKQIKRVANRHFKLLNGQLRLQTA